jgi:ribosomal protein S8
MRSSVDFVNQLNFAITKRENFFICKKSKFNIALLNLMLNEGLILGFYQFKFLKNNLCVFLKYWNKKPIIKKVVLLLNRNITLKHNILVGDLQSNNLVVVSANFGGLCLVSKKTLDSFLWYNRFGGKLLFKILI